MNQHYINLTTALLFLLLSVTTSFAVQKVVILGDNSYPPYTYVEKGEFKGLYVDMLNEVFSKMPDYDVTIEPASWRTGIAKVKSGEAIAIYPPYKTSKREPWMNFDAPLLQEQTVVWGQKEKLAGKNNWPEDFFGTTFVLNSGYSTVGMGGQKFDDAIKAGKIKLKNGKTTKVCFKFLMMGKGDYYLADALLDTSLYQGGKDFASGPVAVEQFSYLGFTKQKEKYPYMDNFIFEFNKQLNLLKASGKIETFLQKYKK